MSPVHSFKQPAFREKMAQVILQVLGNLPELNRNAFVWNHYYGKTPHQIAEILRCTPSEIEAMLKSIDSMLYSKIQALHAEGSHHDTKLFVEDTSQTSAQALTQTIIPPRRLLYNLSQSISSGSQRCGKPSREALIRSFPMPTR